MQKQAMIFKALSDPIRLRLAVLLAICGETCVCQLAEALGEADYKISRHLGILRSSGLVEARREGAWMHYRLIEDGEKLLKSLAKCLRDCLKDEQMVLEDLQRLKNGTCGKESKGE